MLTWTAFIHKNRASHEQNPAAKRLSNMFGSENLVWCPESNQLVID